MESWLARLRRLVRGWLRPNEPPPLTGAPALRREKTYSAENGYVYSYFYLGHRPCRGGTEYVFDVSTDRRRFSPVAVSLSDAALAPWQRAHQRELSGPERYAVAKLALLAAFDRGQALARPQRIQVQPAEADAILETLGID